MRKLKYIAALLCIVCVIGSLNPVSVRAESAGTEVSVNGESLYIRNSFDDGIIPEGYSKGTMQYNGSGISVLKSSDEQITLVYLADEDGENGAFYRYETDGDNNTFSKYIQVSGSDSYLIITEPADVSVPDGYEVVSATINGQTVSAFQPQGGSDGLYLVYGSHESGTQGLYWYDTAEGTYLRYAETDSAAASDPTETEVLQNRLNTLQDEYEANQDMLFKIMCGLMALSGVLVLVIIGMLFRMATLKRKAGNGSQTETESGGMMKFRTADDEADMDDDKELPPPVKREKKKRRKKRAEEDEDYDELESFTEELPELDKVTPDFTNIKVDVDELTDQRPEKKHVAGKTAPELEEETMEEEFLDDDLTGEFEPVKPEEEEPELIAEPLRRADTQDILSGISQKMQEFDKKEEMEEIEDYDDFELEILDLDDE